MEFTGRVLGVVQNYVTGKFQITLEVNESDVIHKFYDKIKDVEKVVVSIVKFCQKRSHTANAYYWQLLSKVAEVNGWSNNYAHNYMLRQYGQKEILGGQVAFVVIADTDEAEKQAMEADTYHIKPTTEVKQGNDGQMYRTYHLIRGSSTYDSKEMSRLIDGLVQEAKDLDIETLPPDVLKHMKEMLVKNDEKIT